MAEVPTYGSLAAFSKSFSHSMPRRLRSMRTDTKLIPNIAHRNYHWPASTMDLAPIRSFLLHVLV